MDEALDEIPILRGRSRMRVRVFTALTLHRFLMVPDVSVECSAAIFRGESVQV